MPFLVGGSPQPQQRRPNYWCKNQTVGRVRVLGCKKVVTEFVKTTSFYAIDAGLAKQQVSPSLRKTPQIIDRTQADIGRVALYQEVQYAIARLQVSQQDAPADRGALASRTKVVDAVQDRRPNSRQHLTAKNLVQ